MTKRSHSILIGFFVLSACFLAVLMLLALGGGNFFSSMLEYKFYFDKSVKGLSSGSPVMFRGVRVGQVKEIKLSLSATDDEYEESSELWPIEVIAELNPAAFGMKKHWYDFLPEKLLELFVNSENLQSVKRVINYMVEKEGLRAQLQTLSFLTGQLSIELNFFPDSPWTQEMARDLGNDVLPVEISGFEHLKKTLSRKEFTGHLDTLNIALQEISLFINDGKFKKFLEDISISADSSSIILENLAEKINPGAKHLGIMFAVLENILDKLNNGLDPLLNSAKDTMEIVAVQGEKITSEIAVLVQETRQFMSRLDEIIEKQEPNIDELLVRLNQSAEKVNDVFAESTKLVQNLQETTAEDSTLQRELQDTLTEIQKAAASMRSLAEFIQSNPEALIRGK